jgi:hypothetical protein
VKFVEQSQFADPDAAARKLVEIANGIEAVTRRLKLTPQPADDISVLRGSEPSQSKHWNVRLPLSPGESAKVR